MSRKGYTQFTLRLPIALYRSIKQEMKIERSKELSTFVRNALESYITRTRAERAYDPSKE